MAEIRRRQNLSQEQLAEQTGLTRSYVAHLEAGRRSRSLEHLLRMLRRSGARVSVEWPQDDDDDPA